MTDTNEPTLRARWLGDQMRELRKSRKLNNSDVGEYLGRHQTTVSKFEAGEYPIQGEELLKLLDLYGVSDLNQRSDLLQLGEDVAQRGWWDGYRPHLNANFADFVWLENNSRKVRSLCLTTMSGLLQTTEYATALISNGPERHDDFQMKRLIEARLLRGKLLNKDGAPEFRFLTHEALLHQLVGDSEVVKGQLRRLLEIAKLPNVELRILPLTCWAHTAVSMTTDYTVFDLREPFPTVVGVDTSAGNIYAEAPDIDLFTETFDVLWRDESLDAKQSTKRITTLIEELTG